MFKDSALIKEEKAPHPRGKNGASQVRRDDAISFDPVSQLRPQGEAKLNAGLGS